MTPDRLNELAAIIMAAHRHIEATEKTAREKRIEAGTALTMAKNGVNRGGWIKWLQLIGLPTRTARRYMEEAESAKSAPTLANSTPRPSSNRAANLAPSRVKQAAQLQKVRAGIIAHPEKSNAKLVKELKSSRETVARERRNLVEEGRIPFLKQRIKLVTSHPQWKLPHKEVLKTTGLVNTILEYLVDIHENMPSNVENALVNPSTDIEENLSWGFLDSLKKIQAMADALHKKFSKKPNLRLVGSESD